MLSDLTNWFLQEMENSEEKAHVLELKDSELQRFDVVST